MDADTGNDAEAYEVEVVDGELIAGQEQLSPARAERSELEVARQAQLARGSAKLQTAAAAATGFVAGAAAFALIRHYGTAKLERLGQQQPQQLPSRWGEHLPARGATYIVHICPFPRPE